MGGVDAALNLRELRERVRVCPVECLFHHFCETVIRPTFDDPEFRNDFAVWAARELRDRALAERLGIINPYEYPDLEQLRHSVVEILDERLSEVPWIPWVKTGHDFRFMRAVTVVFDTGTQLKVPSDLVSSVNDMSLSTIYYHFVEARRRTEGRVDDFTAWLSEFGSGVDDLVRTLAEVDFYFMSLPELKKHLVRAVRLFGEEAVHG